MFWTKVLSFAAGYRLVIGWAILSAACLAGAYVTGRNHANTAWEARWAAAEAKARDDAARVTARHNERLLASNGETAAARAQLAAATYALSVVNGRLRDYAARPRNLPIPADYPGVVAELAAERDRTAACGRLLAAGGSLVQDLGIERDAAVNALWATDTAWPR